jgi:small subunit ribosomal protein S16
MLTIRLIRKGKKNQPFFRVVVTDKKNPPRAGRAVEDLGFVDPLTKRKNLNKERILYWISKGAKPSDSMHNLLVSEKIIEAKKLHVSKLSTKKKAELSKASADAKAAADKQAEIAATTAKSEADKKVKEVASQSEASPAPEGEGSTPAEKPVETPVEEIPEEETK